VVHACKYKPVNMKSENLIWWHIQSYMGIISCQERGVCTEIMHYVLDLNDYCTEDVLYQCQEYMNSHVARPGVSV